MYPERLTYEEGISYLDNREICCTTINDATYESIPEKNIVDWVVGLDESDKTIIIERNKSFYKGIDIEGYSSIKIETYPLSHSISGANMYMFLPTIILMDASYNELSRVSWESFKYSAKGMKKFEVELEVNEAAKYILVFSEEKNQQGFTSMLLTTNSPFIGYQSQGGVRNAPIGGLIFRFQ